tara:strand:+ start:4458 stop:4661 length:204 start_codon:yes stop_codon:yes gene_type:complete
VTDEEKFSFMLAEKLGVFQRDLVEKMTLKEAMGWAEYLQSKNGNSGGKTNDMDALKDQIQTIMRHAQ